MVVSMQPGCSKTTWCDWIGGLKTFVLKVLGYSLLQRGQVDAVYRI
jgi:hypothetical protein